MHTLVVTPTYNERENIEPFVTAVLAVDPTIHILIVDDGSPDGTGRVAEALAGGTTRVRVLHRAGKQGLGSAYVAGFKYALAHGYDYIAQMDADLSHRPQDLPRLLQAATRADLVIGSRLVKGGRVENWPLSRRVISKGGSLYARAVLNMPVKDCTGGFKCFHRRALLSVNLDAVAAHGFGFQVEMTYLCHRAGLRVVEAPIVFPDRTRGRSKMSSKIFTEAAALVWRLRYRAARGSLAIRARPLTVDGDVAPSTAPKTLARASALPEPLRMIDDIVDRQATRPSTVDIA